MKVGAAIYSMLKDDSAVAALVGTRIYPELAEEGAATPYVVYSVVSNTPVDTKESAPVDEAQLEVFSVADTYAAANDLADKVRAALSRKGKVVYDTVTVQSVKYTNEVTEVNAERNLFISVQDYTARTTPVIPERFLNVYSGAWGAYSLRQLDGHYTGPAMLVRRANLDEALIYYDSDGTLDTQTLLGFADGGAAYVKCLYDQSGNGRHLNQDNVYNQPSVVYGDGTLVQINGKPAMNFDGTEDRLFPFDNTGLDLGSISVFNVFKLDDTADIQRIMQISGTPNRFYAPVIAGNTFQYSYGDANRNATANTAQNLHSMIAGSTQGDARAFLNGTQVMSAMSLLSGISGGGTIGGTGADYFDGRLQELIVYDSDQSANRTGIESNIMTHYSIT